MNLSFDIGPLNRGNGAARRVAPPAGEPNGTTRALALRLAQDPDAVRLSLELITQIRAAGLDPDDPRVENLPAALELASRVAREGALWD